MVVWTSLLTTVLDPKPLVVYGASSLPMPVKKVSCTCLQASPHVCERQ